MKKFLYFIGISLAFGCNNIDTPKLKDYAFLKGKWHSIGTDTYEEWTVVNDSILSKTYVVKNDSTVLLDQSCIVQEKRLKLISHLNDKKKISYEYELKYDSNEKLWIFVNENAFPQKLFYSIKKEQNNIYAFVVNNGKKIEFLYEAVN